MTRFRTAPVCLVGLAGLSASLFGCAIDPGAGAPEKSESTSSALSVAGTSGGLGTSLGGGLSTGPVVGPIVDPLPQRPVDAVLRPDAPALQLIASGTGWKTYQVAGTLLDPDTQAFVASNEPIVVADTASAIASAPVSDSIKARIAAEIAALPPEEQAGTFIVRKNIDDQLLALSKASASGTATAVPLLGCSDIDKTYNRSFSSQTPFHYNQGDQSGVFSGSVKIDGTASGSLDAAVTMHVSRVWIPFAGCTTYWGHLKNASLAGTGDVVADTNATGHIAVEWHKQATVLEPVLYNDWISVGGLPVKIKVTLPVQAGIDASARLDVDAKAHIEAHGNFNIVCTSSSCDGSKTTTFNFGPNGTPSIGLNARAKVNPWVQAGVKLELYDGVADGQIAVRATLASDFWGYYGNTCGDANHDSINEWVEAATLDASVLVDLNASVSFFGANKNYSWNLLNEHVAFVDLLGHSTALDPIFYPDSAANYAANMRSEMRPCYPYGDTMHWRIDWADGSAPESFDAAPHTLAARPHTFRHNPILAFQSFAPKLTAIADYRARAINGVATSPTLFAPVASQSAF